MIQQRSTGPSLVERADSAPVPTHCRVAGWASGTQFDLELSHLLHRRLRIVALIAALPLLAFLVRNLLDPGSPTHADSVGQALHVVVTAVALAIVLFLWVRPPMPLCALRKLEVLLFGSLVVFFSWKQWVLCASQTWFGLASEHHQLDVLHVYVGFSALRWFFLIVIYGVFIPNTWRRCTFATGATALLPLIITPASAWYHGLYGPDVTHVLFDLTVLMCTSVAVAVFGAHRLEVLQKQAFEAKQLGQYRLGRKIGAGGMGEVFEAEHVLLRRRCAIKLIGPEQTTDQAVLQRFEREVRAMATLTHPNTVEIYDYGHAEDGTFYYVMEYLPGLNLDMLVKEHGPVPPGRAIHFLRQVCRALREAHGIGLLHRDIKPSNIIACQRGGVDDVVKLLDFGLVQSMRLSDGAGRLTIRGMILGSPPYMSPEQALGRPDLDVRTDIYSLGAVGFYLLTGHPPFVRDTPMEMMLAHAYEPVEFPQGIRDRLPQDLIEVLLGCLNKDPARRPPNIETLEQALAGCADAGQWTEAQATAWWDNLEDSRQTVSPDVLTVASR